MTKARRANEDPFLLTEAEIDVLYRAKVLRNSYRIFPVTEANRAEHERKEAEYLVAKADFMNSVNRAANKSQRAVLARFPLRPCVTCYCLFPAPPNGTATTCSPACRSAWHRKRHRKAG